MTLCPRCAAADQGDKRSGFCDACHYDSLREHQVTREHTDAERRQEEWRQRLERNRREWWANKQARKRLRDRIRPRQQPPRGIDPWEIADDTLAITKLLRPAVPLHSRHRLTEIEERIRWLAWGLDDQPGADQSRQTG